MYSTRTQLGWTATGVALASILGAAIATPLSAGTVVGTVKFTGTVPAVETIAVAQDTSVCGTEQTSPELVVDSDQGLQWAVLQVSSARGATESSEQPKLDQNGCTFNPRVVVVRPGEEMAVLNSDNILHNVHTHSEENPPMNMAQPGFVKTLPLTFDESEVIKVKCDVHGWMTGWILVTDSRYTAVSDETGSFSLADVPAGTHQLSIWHEKLGEQTQEITVLDAQETQVNFEFTGE